MAIQSQPPGTLNGRLRVTEQGEMIQSQFGQAGIALRTLEVYTTSTLRSTLFPPKAPVPEWRELMDHMSALARKQYRDAVYGMQSRTQVYSFRAQQICCLLSSIHSRARAVCVEHWKSGMFAAPVLSDLF